MKNLIKKIFLILIILIMFILETNVYAVGSFSISASKTTIDPGESIILTITGNNAIGELIITATNANVSSYAVFLENAYDSKSVTITSTSNDNIEITVAPGSHGLGSSDETQITESKYLTINVNKPYTPPAESNPPQEQTPPTTTTTPPTSTEKSTNSTLRDFGIKPNDFSGFKPNITSYNTTVPNNVDSIDIYAYSPRGLENKQKITGAGKKNLNVGENKFEVVVTAEAGNTTTYTLNVTREGAEEEEEKPEETEPVEPEDVVEFGLSDLTIEGLKLSPRFQTDVYEYKAELTKDLNELNITASDSYENSTIEILGNENLVEGENIITIIVKNGEGDEEKNVTYQIIVNKNTQKQAIANTYQKQVNQEKNKRMFIIGAIVAIIAIIAIVTIYIKTKRTKMMVNEEFEDDDIDDENFEHKEYSKEQNNDFEEFEDENEYDEEQYNKKQSRGKRFK